MSEHDRVKLRELPERVSVKDTDELFIEDVNAVDGSRSKRVKVSSIKNAISPDLNTDSTLSGTGEASSPLKVTTPFTKDEKDKLAGLSSGIDVADIPEHISDKNLGLADRLVEATYASSVRRTPELTGNIEQSNNQNLAIGEAGVFGLNKVGGGEIVFRKLSTNEAANQPDTFKLLYVGLNNSEHNLLLVSDQTTGFQTGELTINSRTFSSLNFYGQYSGVRYNGHQVRFAIIAHSNDITTPFRAGATAAPVTISIDGYEALTANARTERVIVSEPKIAPPSSVEIKHAIPSPANSDRPRVLYLDRNQTGSETDAHLELIESSDNLLYSIGAIQPGLSGQRLGRKLDGSDELDRLSGINIFISPDTAVNPDRIWVATKKDSKNRWTALIVEGLTKEEIALSNETVLAETLEINGKEYTLLRYDYTLEAEQEFPDPLPNPPNTANNVRRYNINLKRSDDSFLFDEGRKYQPDFYAREDGSDYYDNVETKDTIRKVDRIPGIVNGTIKLENTYTEGHRGLDFELNSTIQALRQSVIVSGELWQVDQSAGYIRNFNAATRERNANKDINIANLIHVSSGGLTAVGSTLYYGNNSTEDVLVFSASTGQRNTSIEGRFDLAMRRVQGIFDCLVWNGTNFLVGEQTGLVTQNFRAYTATGGAVTANNWDRANIAPAQFVVDAQLVTGVPVSHQKRGGTTEIIDYNPRLEFAPNNVHPAGDGQYNLMRDILYLLCNTTQKAYAYYNNKTKLPSAYDITLPTGSAYDYFAITTDGTNILIGDNHNGHYRVIKKTDRSHLGNNYKVNVDDFYVEKTNSDGTKEYERLLTRYRRELGI